MNTRQSAGRTKSVSAVELRTPPMTVARTLNIDRRLVYADRWSLRNLPDRLRGHEQRQWTGRCWLETKTRIEGGGSFVLCIDE